MGAATVGETGSGSAAAGPADGAVQGAADPPQTTGGPAGLGAPQTTTEAPQTARGSAGLGAPQTTADLGRALAQVMRAVSRAKDLARPGGGLPEVASFPLLVALVEAGSMRASDLAQAVLSDRSTVSRQVAHLVDLGYVERRPDPADRRAYHLALTEAGARALDARRRARDAHLAHLTRTWSEDDRRTLARLLDRLARELTTELRQGGLPPHRPTHPQEGP